MLVFAREEVLRHFITINPIHIIIYGGCIGTMTATLIAKQMSIIQINYLNFLTLNCIQFFSFLKSYLCAPSLTTHLKFVLHLSIYILAQILVHLHVWLFSCSLKFPVCSCNCCAHNSVVISNIDWFYNKSLSTVFTVLYILYVHLPSVTCLPIKISRYLTEWWKFAIGGGNLVFCTFCTCVRWSAAVTS